MRRIVCALIAFLLFSSVDRGAGWNCVSSFLPSSGPERKKKGRERKPTLHARKRGHSSRDT